MILEALTGFYVTADMLAPAAILWAWRVDPEPVARPDHPSRIPYFDLRAGTWPFSAGIRGDLANQLINDDLASRHTDPLVTYYGE